MNLVGRNVAAAFFAVFILAACSGSADTASTTTTISDSDEKHEHEDEHHDDDDDDHDDEDNDHQDNHDDSSGGLGAHEHGVAELSVAWSDNVVIVDLITPTHNVFGFEHEPSTDEEHSVVNDSTKALGEPDIIVFNPEAGCTLTEQVETELHFEASHSELTVSWYYDCDQPEDIKQLDIGPLFSRFANLEQIAAQWVSDNNQSASELSPSAAILEFG